MKNNCISCNASSIRTNHLKLLSKILNNITNHKNVAKYKDLHFLRTTTKLDNCQSCIQLLFDAGFDLRNGSRLIFDLNKMNKLKSLQTLLLSQNNSSKSAENAINMSIMNDSSSDQVKSTVVKPTLEAQHSVIANTECSYHVSVCSSGVLQLLQTHHYHDDPTVLINDFIHLLIKHNTDEEFNFIVDQLKHCDVKSCKYINHSNTGNTFHKIEIFNKIHCYFHHMHDFGNRLTNKEKSFILSDQTSDSSDSMRKKCQILLAKKKKLNLDMRSNQRYNQLSDNVYGFGQLFSYGYICEHSSVNVNAIRVYAKYTSLKHELIQNGLLMRQYKNEYKKAEIHFNSCYCKQIESYHQVDKVYYSFVDILKKDISLHHILSLMIYCNYDNFQKLFSQTYRNNIHEHERFYHLGMYLKQSVHWFGTYHNNKTISKFYHGIDKRMIFIQTGKSDNMSTNGVSINGPLSTSSSCEVAINFAGYNGLVLELNIKKNEFETILSPPSEEMKYFSVAWLSDYPAERECVFIQNGQHFLCIQNIIDIEFGVEYENILCAINGIQQLTSISKFFKPVSDEIYNLMKIICYHQLSYTLFEYKKFKSLCPYGKKLVKHYFEYKYEFVLDWFCQPKCTALNFLLFSRFPWIKMDLLAKLFPNLREFGIVHVDLCDETMEYILNFCRKENKIKFRQIAIKPAQLSTISVSKAMNKYKSAFSAVDYQLTQKFKRFGKEVNSDLEVEWNDFIFIQNDKIECTMAEKYAQTNKQLTVSMQQTCNSRHINDLGKVIQEFMSAIMLAQST
eukprot:405456_1